MVDIYQSGYAPDPHNARDVLAFILCPVGVLIPGIDAGEQDAVLEMLIPIREEAARRWSDANKARVTN